MPAPCVAVVPQYSASSPTAQAHLGKQAELHLDMPR
jgi:hypothetical protein